MKIYLASSFELVPTVKIVADSLKNTGHTITQEWWHFDFKTIKGNDKEWYQLEEVKQISRKNFEAIIQADCLLLVAHPETPKKFNGANIELGFALALGKPCYSIGKLERSAMYVPVHKFPSLSEFREAFDYK